MRAVVTMKEREIEMLTWAGEEVSSLEKEECEIQYHGTVIRNQRKRTQYFLLTPPHSLTHTTVSELP